MPIQNEGQPSHRSEGVPLPFPRAGRPERALASRAEGSLAAPPFFGIFSTALGRRIVRARCRTPKEKAGHGAEENRELAPRAYVAFGREDMDAAFAVLSEDIEWINHEDTPFGGIYHGHDGTTGHFAVPEAVDHTRFEIRNIVGDDDGAIAVADIADTVKAAGKSTEGRSVQILPIEDGKITRYEEVAAADRGAWE